MMSQTVEGTSIPMGGLQAAQGQMGLGTRARPDFPPQEHDPQLL